MSLNRNKVSYGKGRRVKNNIYMLWLGKRLRKEEVVLNM